ncbi:MAG: MBL fold metallo-hydrolase [Candidatus Eisenbacteria bacterium]|nr:MBL fold metallo-hydrolase [Candidatus Eisenbacteria bacterium]
MRIEQIESKGLAHFSYFLADGGGAFVIDPRMDADIYVELARQESCRIAGIFETHRNEDYVIGSAELAARTGAPIRRADSQLPYEYGEPAKDGRVFEIGSLHLRALHTPGHTPGSMSYVLSGPDEQPRMVFTGDALFAGDVGRTDLMGENRLVEQSRALHDTIFNTILPLGDEVVLCPAHGAGSVCGGSISDRRWTTIGIERRLNPMLSKRDPESFVSAAAVVHPRPPYFDAMERMNLVGATLPKWVLDPPVLDPADFLEEARAGRILDARSHLEFGASHIPGALSIWPEGVAGFAGWFLPVDQPLLLAADEARLQEVIRALIRIGYLDLRGYLAGGMTSWHTAGRDHAAVPMIGTHDLCRRLDSGEEHWILDVRTDQERESAGRIRGAHGIPLPALPQRLDEVPAHKPVHIFCGSGLRSMTAASLLFREGGYRPTVVLGGFSGWSSTSCPIDL